MVVAMLTDSDINGKSGAAVINPGVDETGADVDG